MTTEFRLNGSLIYSVKDKVERCMLRVGEVVTDENGLFKFSHNHSKKNFWDDEELFVLSQFMRRVNGKFLSHRNEELG